MQESRLLAGSSLDMRYIADAHIVQLCDCCDIWLTTSSPLSTPFLQLLALLALEVGIEIPLEVLTGIIEPQLLVNTVNLLDILRIELEVALEVVLDSALRLALGEDRASGQTSACALSQQHNRHRAAYP